MRFVGISLTVVGLSSLLVSVLITNAVLGRIHQYAKAPVGIGEWTTTVIKE
jgi:hypothetical protein